MNRFKNARGSGIAKNRQVKEKKKGDKQGIEGSWNVKRVVGEGGKEKRGGRGGRGRRGRGGRGGHKGAKPTQESLDKELESYMFKDKDTAKTMLDNDLDSYMMDVETKMS